MNIFKKLLRKSDFDKPHFCKITVECWYCTIFFSFGETFEEFKTHFKDEYKNKLDDYDTASGYCVHLEDTYIIRMKNVPNTIHDLGILQHEIHHAITHILMDKGVKYTQSNHEAFAYMFGYVTEQIYSILQKYK